MQIAIILGSIRTGRQSHKIAKFLVRMLQDRPDVEPILLDLAEYDLPLYRERWAEQDPPTPVLASFSQVLKSADALLFISPEYHGSYSGVLKNAVDHFWGEFKQKPIGVVATGSGRFGGINASTEMQQLVLSIGAYPIPQKLLVPFVDRVFDEQGNPTDERLTQQVHDFLQAFLWFSNAIASAKLATPK
ncbi:NAD(P)H-dependent oxidoreductase [Pontibacter sp. G13]|uniref:NADPH-dependent FMN reductase n=1 Tax=Pontibacter sp. G13 TaxID=3074898 RepID=UPI00288A8601|nr:NAD(P)H-dependent oxidoreductase [Pontibacter sp. G13]WNJ16482.1 NAD(P)H-dependent oxidoreductase [Pontibacter sp. G13]